MVTRFTIEQISEALQRAKLDEDTLLTVFAELINIRHFERKPAGRPAEDDSARLLIIEKLVADKLSRWRAAGIATQDLEEPARKTARLRLYRKSGKLK